MFKNDKEPTVKEIIAAGVEQKIWIPEFQREFVWERSQIKLLIDSLYNGYTISSILTWEGPDQLARRRVGGSIREITTPGDGGLQCTYLLDGQQRTTALVLVFTNTSVYKRKKVQKTEVANLFLDTMYQGDDPERRFVYDDEIIDVNGEEFTLDQFKEKEMFDRFGPRFIGMKKVYDSSENINVDFEWLKSVIKDEKQRLEYVETLHRVQNNILSRPVPRINQQGELQSVLEIFSRINTQNTKLNICDIMVAKTYRKFGNKIFDLRTYMKLLNYQGTIKPDYFETVENHDPDKVAVIFKDDEETLLFLIMVLLRKDFKQKEILKITTEDLMTNLKPLHKSYWAMITLIEKEFQLQHSELSDISPMLKFVAAFVSELNGDLSVEQREFVKEWFWNTILYNRYPGAQNEKVKSDYEKFKLLTSAKAIEAYRKERTRRFDNENYFDARYGERSQLRDALTIMLKHHEPKDFYNGIQPTRSSHATDALEEHHIFPLNSKIGKILAEQTKDTDDASILNNIANIAFITRETNNKKIGCKDPSEYIVAFEQEYVQLEKQQEFKQIMLSQFIDEEMIQMLKQNDFFNFIKKRTALLKNNIDTLCPTPK